MSQKAPSRTEVTVEFCRKVDEIVEKIYTKRVQVERITRDNPFKQDKPEDKEQPVLS